MMVVELVSSLVGGYIAPLASVLQVLLSAYPSPLQWPSEVIYVSYICVYMYMYMHVHVHGTCTYMYMYMVHVHTCTCVCMQLQCM